MLSWEAFSHHMKVSGLTCEDPMDTRTMCCICYRIYGTTATVHSAEGPVQLACGHVFGTTCMRTWASTNSTCPLCRAHLNWTALPCSFQPWLDDSESSSRPLASSPDEVWLSAAAWTSSSPGDSGTDPYSPLSTVLTEGTPHVPDPTDRNDHRQQHSNRRKRALSSHEHKDIWLTVFENEFSELHDPVTVVSVKTVSTKIQLEQAYTASDSLFNELLVFHEQWMSQSFCGVDLSLPTLFVH